MSGADLFTKKVYRRTETRERDVDPVTKMVKEHGCRGKQKERADPISLSLLAPPDFVTIW